MGRKRKKIVTPMQGEIVITQEQCNEMDKDEIQRLMDVPGKVEIYKETTVTAEVVMEPVYSFPSRSRCPRCQSINTKAVGKHSHTQYRVCQQPICRRRYAVKGELV